MWTRRARAPESDLAAGLDRRAFLGGAAALLLAPWASRARAEAALAAETVALLEKSDYVYVSPLLASGAESTCHGEVWFGWIGGSVYVITSRDRWKSRAALRGLGARIWVGDHGRWKRTLGRNEAFRAAPHFDAGARAVKDDAAFGELMKIFARKYGEEFTGKWKPRMETGYADGSRVLLRYEPVTAPRT
jgi:hypothetical protein